MRMYYFILTLFLSSLTVAYSQAADLHGIVMDKEDGGALAGAIVQVRNSAGSMIGYSIAADDGSFSLNYKECSTGLSLSVQCMGYRTQTFDLAEIESPFTIRLQPQPTVLKDVLVKAPDIEQRSDTLVYYVNKYARAQDRNIADVLKRLPGIKVEDDGQIKYNGEPINKFYIDGADFMDGRYGLATENISPSDVASVEVLENHQPLQVLKGLEFSEQAGLNLKLKEGSRRRWIGMITGQTGGSPLLYDAALFAMRIAGKWQNMETVRVNDTGWNPFSQSALHTKDQLFGAGYQEKLWSDYIAVGNVVSPLAELRTRDNRSILANTSNSWRIGKEYDAKFNLNYENDRLAYQTGYVTHYLESGLPTFEELNSMRTQVHRLNGVCALQANRPAFYLKDKLAIAAEWNEALSEIGGTTSLTQRAETPSFNIGNDWQLVKRINHDLLTLSSRNTFAYTPHSLNVADTSFITQHLTTTDFRSITEIRYGRLIHHWNVYARGGIDFDYHRVKSDLMGVTGMDYSMTCDKHFSLLRTFVSPELSYESTRWLFTLSIPFNAYRYPQKHYWTVSPTIYARHQLNAKTAISAQIKYALLPPSPDKFIPTLLLTDFRHLYLGHPVYESSKERSAFFLFRYRNPITSFFANLSTRFQYDYSPTMQNQLFIKNYVLTTTSLLGNSSKNLQFNGSISKGMMGGKIVFGLEGSFSQTWATAMRQDVATPYVVKSLAVQPTLKGTFMDILSVNYKFQGTYRKMNINRSEKSSYTVLKQSLGLTFIPVRNWIFTANGEHYCTKFNSGDSAPMLLLDASLRFRLSKALEFSFTATNLFNKQEYRYADYGLLSETAHAYKLRGRNLLIGMQLQL